MTLAVVDFIQENGQFPHLASLQLRCAIPKFCVVRSQPLPVRSAFPPSLLELVLFRCSIELYAPTSELGTFVWLP